MTRARQLDATYQSVRDRIDYRATRCCSERRGSGITPSDAFFACGTRSAPTREAMCAILTGTARANPLGGVWYSVSGPTPPQMLHAPKNGPRACKVGKVLRLLELSSQSKLAAQRLSVFTQRFICLMLKRPGYESRCRTRRANPW